jgi:hypothetical protein
MKFSKYILNLILFDYELLNEYKSDTIAISALVFSSFKRDFKEADSHKILDYFIHQKMKSLN